MARAGHQSYKLESWCTKVGPSVVCAQKHASKNRGQQPIKVKEKVPFSPPTTRNKICLGVLTTDFYRFLNLGLKHTCPTSITKSERKSQSYLMVSRSPIMSQALQTKLKIWLQINASINRVVLDKNIHNNKGPTMTNSHKDVQQRAFPSKSRINRVCTSFRVLVTLCSVLFIQKHNQITLHTLNKSIISHFFLA